MTIAYSEDEKRTVTITNQNNESPLTVIDHLRARIAELEAEVKLLDNRRTELCKASAKKSYKISELDAKLAALVEVAQRLVDHAKNSDQELWASLPDVIALRNAIERTK